MSKYKKTIIVFTIAVLMVSLLAISKTLAKDIIFDPGEDNVGIGTSIPGAKLDVVGGINLTDRTYTVDNAVDTFENVAGYYPGLSPNTGTVAITINNTPNMMVEAEIVIQGYGGITTCQIRGYTYTGSTTWYMPAANCVSSGHSGGYTVRFAKEVSDNDRVILIGNTTSSWGNYPHVAVTRVTKGYPGTGTDIGDWSINIVTDETPYTSITGVNTNSGFKAYNAEFNGSTYSILAGNDRIGNLASPVDNTDAANKSYVDSAIIPADGYIGNTGSHTAGGVLSMNSNKIIDLATPTLNTDAVPKSYVDSAIVPADGYIGNTGSHTAGGELSMNSNKIINLATPTLNTDAATKLYVDDTVSASGGGTVISVDTGTGLTGGPITSSGKINFDTSWGDGRYLTEDASDTMDAGTDTTLTILSDDTGRSRISLYGNSQGTGQVYVGQSTTHGGGIEYNGDNSPTTTGAGSDYITLYRVSGGTWSWTARNLHSSNDWSFRGAVAVATPTVATHAATKSYVDSAIVPADGYIGNTGSHTAGGDLNMGGHNITNTYSLTLNNTELSSHSVVNGKLVFDQAGDNNLNIYNSNLARWVKIWDDSNDGSGSGLDADKVDNYQTSEGNVGSTVAVRSSSGDIRARLFRPEYTSLNSGTNISYFWTSRETGTGDNYLRPTTRAAVKSQLEADGLNASTLGGVGINSFLRSDANDTFTGKLSVGSTATRQAGMYGTYDSYKTGHIWSMGTAYAIPQDGSTFGNLYGLAYKHTNNTTGGTMAGGHQMVWATNGNPSAAMGTNVWTSGSVLASGGNFSSPITVGTPTSASHAATMSYVDSSASGNTYWSANGTHIYNSNSGNVGIGTTSPSTKLEVTGGSYPTAAFTNNVSGKTLYVGGGSQSNLGTTEATIGVTSGNLHIDSYSASKIYFQHYAQTDTIFNVNGGNVGIGTASPGAKLHVVDSSFPIISERSGGNDYPGSQYYSMRSYNSYGTTNTGIFTGISFNFDDGNNTSKNYAGIGGYKEYGAAGAHRGALVFLTAYGGATPAERMRITSTGNVGIGTTSPEEKFHVNGNIKVMSGNIRIADNPGTGTSPINYVWQGGAVNSTSKQYAFAINDSLWVTSHAFIDGNVTAAAFYYSSDKRLKDNIVSLGSDESLDVIDKLNPVSFTWKEDGTASQGFIAQEVEQVLPELVKSDESSGMKSLQYGNLTAVLTAGIKAQQEKINDLETELEILKIQVNSLKNN